MKKVVDVKLDSNLKSSLYIIENIKVKNKDLVIVETDNGIQLGHVLHHYREYSETDISSLTKKVLRLATKEDLQKHKQNEIESKKALREAEKIALELNLDMQFLDANYTLDRNQLFFLYIADTRVDFRILAKKLAAKYKTRIELRQIGVRDKAQRIGGIGPCGLVLCYNQFLEDFAPVSINMAKNQDLALNPTKINGLCGRLLCCLNYEDELYKELRKDMPEIGTIVETKYGKGKVKNVNIFNHTYDVELENNEIIVESV